MVLSLTAKGLTSGEISAHFAEIYGTSVSKETISRITDSVVDAMVEWQNRPLDRAYLFTGSTTLRARWGRPFVCRVVTLSGLPSWRRGWRIVMRGSMCWWRRWSS